jgi:hypothetical protein
MKKQLSKLPFLLIVLAVLALTSCRKQDNIDDSISAEDESSVSSSLNSTTDDAANAVGEIQALSGKTDGLMGFCGATIDSSQKMNGIIVITFNGNDCSGRVSRTGSITATLENYANGTRWRDQGAVLHLAFSDVRITSIATGAYCTLNGTHTLTNETGGLAWRVANGLDQGTVTRRHTATDFSVTYADGSQRTWSVNRLRTFTNDGTTRTVTVSSDHTEGGVAYADAWGTNRNGASFVNAIVSPITVTSANSQCPGNWFNRPASGEVTHSVGIRSVAVQFGVDANGDAVSNGTCPYGFEITFTKNGHSRTKVVSYWF